MWGGMGGEGAGTRAGGVWEHVGWDPIGNGAGDARVFSTFANPIFFGSYLLMSTVVTLGLALDRKRGERRWPLPIVVLPLGVQLAAMWFTGSRGPWLAGQGDHGRGRALGQSCHYGFCRPVGAVRSQHVRMKKRPTSAYV